MMPINNDTPASTPQDASPPIGVTEIMIQMQNQQLQLQQQITNLMTQFVTSPSDTNPARSQRPAHRSTKPTRPTIEADSSDNGWIIFKDSWDRYKQMVDLTDPVAIRNELRSTCSPRVNEMLFNFVGPEVLNNASEDDLLGYIKSVAVKVVHPEVYRQQFFNLRQSDGETITSFVSRLKAQAMLCDFQSNGSCGALDCSSSYAANMIRSQLIAGVRNPTHQNKVLTEIATLKTLEQLTARLLALEATERASSHFRSPFEATTTDVAPIKSSPPKFYKHNSSNTNTTYKKQCPGCGKPIHPGGRQRCPAWQTVCHKCKKPNHFANVCRSLSSISGIANEEPDQNVSYLSSINALPL